MSGKKDGLKSALVLVLIFAVFALLLAGMNTLLAPAIERGGAAAQLAPLYAVMPEAGVFEPLYDAAEPDASELSGVPDTVRSIYRESSGMGYVLCLSTSEGYTKEPIEITMAVNAEGKIAAVEITAYPETKELGEGYTDSYIGQDSTLAEVSLVSGATYSSAALRGAVADGFDALIANGLVGAGVKGDAQILEELMPVAFPGMANSAGVSQYEEQDISSAGYEYIQKSMKALTGTAMAYIVKDGESSYLALCNAGLVCKVVNTEGADVTASVPQALIDEVKQDAAGSMESNADKEMTKLSKLVPEGAEISALPLDGVFNSVTGAYSISTADGKYYGFVSTSFGYSNLPLVTYYVLDENGAIAAMNADELILIKEYFTDYELDEPAYKAGFEGVTADTWSGEQALISGATVTSDAVSTAISDVFEAFAVVAENGGEE